MKYPLLSLSLLCFIGNLCAQKATLDPFEGTIYYMPGEELQQGYNDRLAYFEVLGKVTLKELNIPKSYEAASYFPGVWVRNGFGIVFNSKLTIDQPGCFEFYLESDDGSRLWLNEKQIIDNDGPHIMRTKRDTLSMQPGAYQLKLWYYSAFPSQYGLIFKVNPLHADLCTDLPSENQSKFTLQSVLFDFDKYELTQGGKAELDRIVILLQARYPIKKLKIIGHTDATGNEKYNMELSLRRAQSVSQYLQSKLDPQIVMVAEGKGASMPLTHSTDEKEMQLNRRVEILIE